MSMNRTRTLEDAIVEFERLIYPFHKPIDTLEFLNLLIKDANSTSEDRLLPKLYKGTVRIDFANEVEAKSASSILSQLEFFETD